MCDCAECCTARRHYASWTEAHDEANRRWVQSRVSVRADECRHCNRWVVIPW